MSQLLPEPRKDPVSLKLRPVCQQKMFTAAVKHYKWLLNTSSFCFSGSKVFIRFLANNWLLLMEWKNENESSLRLQTSSNCCKLQKCWFVSVTGKKKWKWIIGKIKNKKSDLEISGLSTELPFVWVRGRCEIIRWSSWKDLWKSN